MQENFLRKEYKYLIQESIYVELLEKLQKYVVKDVYDKSHILTVYYDTEDYRLITRSIEKPMFKEKLRIRSYDPPLDNDDVYVELKKKYKGVVYKNRTKTKYKDVLHNIYTCEFEDEIMRDEIRNLYDRYGGVFSKIFISCDREYYIGKDDPSLRITIDTQLKYRIKDISLKNTEEDKKIEDTIIMEVKAVDALPLWLVNLLEELHIYRTSYSKVGTAFLMEIERIQNGII